MIDKDQANNKKELLFELYFKDKKDKLNSEKFNSIENYLDLDFEKNLNEDQLKIVNNIKGPVLVIAGAGSGKTRTIVYAVAKLISEGIRPAQIMLVTFTNKAASEMLDRTQRILGKNLKGIWAGTFHSIANQFLRKYAKNLGMKASYTIIDELDATTLMKLCLNSTNLQDFDERLPTAKIAKKILSYSINCNKSIQEVINWKYNQFDSDKILTKLNEIFDVYKYKKAKDNLVDFDDLLTFWNKLLDDKLIAQRIARDIKYIFVDEYQDTNYIQAEIIYKLSLKNPEKNVIAVGDDAQSIYAFRGADYKNILQFPKRYKDCKTYKLSYNYRSIPEILDFANESIKHNKFQFKKEMKTIRKNSLKPFHIIIDDDEAQAQFIVEQIIDLESKGYKLKEIAILYRAGFHSLKIELELQRNGIPYIVRSGYSFLEKSHIKDLLAHLRVIENPYDEVSWSRIFAYVRGVGETLTKRILEEIMEMKDPIESILDYNFFSTNLKGVKISKNARKNLISHIKKFKLITKNNKPSEVILNLINFFEQSFKTKYSNWQERIEDINQLRLYSQNYNTIQSFLETLTLNSSNIDSKKVFTEINEFNEDPLILTTIHRAKGLEWKIVFIPMLVETLFPSNKVPKDSTSFEEERRVFYVAITRAKDRLYLISPQKIYGFGFPQTLITSQFISELNPKVYQNYSVQDRLEFEKLKTRDNKFNKPKSRSLFTTADNLIKE